MVPKMLERFPPVTRPRMFEVARPESLRKLAMLSLGTLNSPKLMKQIWAASRSGAARDVELSLSSGRRRRQGDLCVEPRGRNGRGRRGQGDRARDSQEEREDEDETWN